MNSKVLKAALNHGFFEVAEETEDLLIELNVGGFKLLVDVSAEMVYKLGLGKGLASFSLFFAEVSYCWLGNGVERDFFIVAVSVFFKLDVAHFFV